jgi:PIN domain nuclease of toxin-antitoxin system
MNCIVDACSLIWAVDDPAQLSPTAAGVLRNKANSLYLSAATVWEISIKVGLGKLTISAPFRPWIEQAINDLDLVLLPITVAVSDEQSRLPWHHRDPFDRIVVAHCGVDGL